MTIDHPRWEEFIERLDGPEGCNFHLAVAGDTRSATWTWDCDELCPLATRMLAEMGLTPDEIEESLSCFREQGAFCDCEILSNLTDN
jgi:hypothetical protein